MSRLNILKKNILLKNRFKGHRCFILGCGPSINNQDLVLIADDISIAINNFYFHKDIQRINPNYWICADPKYFNTHQDEYLPIISAIEEREVETNFFFPIVAYQNIKIKSQYFCTINYFNFDYSNTKVDNIDFSCSIPPYSQNGICIAIMLAFYLGCNPIYLLGCDHTWWSWHKEEYAGKKMPHFYKLTDSTSKNFSYNILKSTILVQKYQYFQLKKYAQNRGYEIINATSGGYLEIFKRIAYEKLFSTDHKNNKTFQLLKKTENYAHDIAQAAIQLINSGNFLAALVLVEEAISTNINSKYAVKGLEKVRQTCYYHLQLSNYRF